MDKKEAIEILEEEKGYAEEGYHGTPRTAEALTLAIDTLKRIEVEPVRQVIGVRLNIDYKNSLSVAQSIVTYLTEGK